MRIITNEKVYQNRVLLQFGAAVVGSVLIGVGTGSVAIGLGIVLVAWSLR